MLVYCCRDVSCLSSWTSPPTRDNMSRWLPWWQSALFICCCAGVGGRGGCCVQGVVGRTECCSGWYPENGRWNPKRGKGQPKINPYRVGRPGPHHTRHQIRKQCPFYYRIVWQSLNCPGRCADHMIWQLFVFQKFDISIRGWMMKVLACVTSDS